MPRTRSLAWSELKIGVLALFALTMAGVLIFAVGGEGGFFWQRYPLKTSFASVPGLKSGSPVRVAGVEVGAVTRMQFGSSGVEVWFEISREAQRLVTDRSIAVLGSISLLGESAVDVTAAPDGTPLPSWGTVRTGKSAGSLSDVAADAGESLGAARDLVNDLRAGRGSLGRLLTEDALYADLERLVQSAERVTSAVSSGKGSVGRLVRDPAAANMLTAALADLQALTGQLRRGEGTLGVLLTNREIAERLTTTSARLEDITTRLSRGEGTAGRLLRDEALYDRITALTSRLDTVTAGLAAGDGTAGRLLRDRTLYENMTTVVSELRGLVSDIRRDPRKYLTVKVSLF